MEKSNKVRKSSYFYSTYYNEVRVGRILWLIGIFIFIISLTLSLMSFMRFDRERYQLGDGYLKLAQESSSIEMAVDYLEQYKKSIEDNSLNKGTAGFYYKTPNNDMANRFNRLTKGIEFLNLFTGKTELDNRINTLDINMYSMMIDSSNNSDTPALRQYISSLDVGIGQYLSANFIGWRFFDVGRYLFTILASALFIVVIVTGVCVHDCY